MVVDIFKEVRIDGQLKGIKFYGLCHMDGRKKETKGVLKRLKELKLELNKKVD